MACPYCGSLRTVEEYTVRTYDLPNELVAINHVLCARCGECYSRIIREDSSTGRRRSKVSRMSCLTEDIPVVSNNRIGLLSRFLGRIGI